MYKYSVFTKIDLATGAVKDRKLIVQGFDRRGLNSLQVAAINSPYIPESNRPFNYNRIGKIVRRLY